jgi:hypothetical protein
MKKLFVLVASLIFLAGIAAGQSGDTISLKVGKEAKGRTSKVRIKFLSVVEDSRCPANVNCIHAGNARIKVLVKSSRETREFEMNTGIGPQGNQLDGWAINLISLTPSPTTKGAPSPRSYTAKFTVSRLTR